MQAGKLKHRITLQRPAAGQDAYGQPLTGWTDVATVWASITDMTGREYIAAAAVQASVQTRITIRYRADIVAAMRVLHGTDVYNIAAVLEWGRDALNLMCEKGVGDGR